MPSGGGELRSLLASAFVLWLAVAPFLESFRTGGLAVASAAKERVTYYRNIVLTAWPMTAIAIALAWPLGAFVFSAARPAWTPAPAVAFFLAAAAIFALGLPFVKLSLGLDLGPAFAAQLADSAYLLPRSRDERATYLAVAFTSGVYEEVVYRGFAIWYAAMVLPHAGPLAWIALSALLFGLAHLPQGPAGVLKTAALGCFFGFLFLVSGSIVLPIVVHVVMDARFAALPERIANAAAEAARRAG